MNKYQAIAILYILVYCVFPWIKHIYIYNVNKKEKFYKASLIGYLRTTSFGTPYISWGNINKIKNEYKQDYLKNKICVETFVRKNETDIKNCMFFTPVNEDGKLNYNLLVIQPTYSTFHVDKENIVWLKPMKFSFWKNKLVYVK